MLQLGSRVEELGAKWKFDTQRTLSVRAVPCNSSFKSTKRNPNDNDVLRISFYSQGLRGTTSEELPRTHGSGRQIGPPTGGYFAQAPKAMNRLDEVLTSQKLSLCKDAHNHKPKARKPKA